MSNRFARQEVPILEALFCRLQNAGDVKLVHDFTPYRLFCAKVYILDGSIADE